MLTTLRNILLENAEDIGDTIYNGTSGNMLDFKISAGDHFNLCMLPEEMSVHAGDILDQKDLIKEVEELRQEIKRVKLTDDLEHLQTDYIKELRARKRMLEQKLSAPAEEKRAVSFKDCVYAVSAEDLMQILPQFRRVDFPYFREMPYFAGNLEAFCDAVQAHRQVAVTGGPCLFGENEVIMQIHLWNGECREFDYSTGKLYMQPESHMVRYTEEMAEQIADVSFINRKTDVTAQEFDSILYLFETAEAFDAKITIPLPDMSYIKYLEKILEPLDRKIAGPAIGRFRRIAYEISDMYIAVIAFLKKKYPDLTVTVVHERDKEICQRYYEKRAGYIEKKAVLRGITGIPEKLEAIKDYISMPALPYYIYGIRDILQIDSLDETDSYRKCRSAHKKDIALSALMYPERISADGENTIFHTLQRYKEYMQTADYENRLQGKNGKTE